MPNTRTLILGIGGTGTKIIRCLSDQWLAERGHIPDHVSMAVIDAKSDGPDEGPIHGAEFCGTQPIPFRESFEEFQDSVRPWWPGHEPNDDIDFSGGCGMIRANGRFMAFRFASNIDWTVRKLVDHQIRRARAGGETPDGFDVYIACSLGNGTGGGAFMEVAAIARDAIGRFHPPPCIRGVFIPGSATRRGYTSDMHMEDQVASAGLASLIELQYEFNREADEAWKPSFPYVFEGIRGITLYRYTCGEPGTDVENRAPYDLAFILDQRDRLGRLSTYPDLLGVAARSLALLVSGADADARLYDMEARLTQGRRFASLGTGRLIVPADELGRFAALEQALGSLDLARSSDPDDWPELFEMAGPDGETGPTELSLSDSVDHFIDHVLCIKETDCTRGAPIDDLIGLFAEEDQILRRGFDELLGDFDAGSRQDRVHRMLEAHHFVAQVAGGLPRTRRAWLIEGPCSKWLREPAKGSADENADPPDAGVKWLIDQQVERIVTAGAFGLLRSWLSEMMRQVGQNKAWVATQEKQKYLSRRSSDPFEIEQDMRQLRTMADSFLSRLFHPRLDHRIEGISLEARDLFDFLLWESKLQAIMAFYDVVEDYLANLEHAANRIVRWLSQEAESGTLRAQKDDARRHLDDCSEQDQRPSPDATWYAGADRSTRGILLRALRDRPETRERTLLGTDADSNRQLFLAALGDARAWFDPSFSGAEAAEEERAAIERYTRDLSLLCRSRVETAIGPLTTLEDVLLREAHALLAPYLELRRAGKAAHARQSVAIRDRLGQKVGSRILEAIDLLDSREDKGERDEAVRLYLAGRLGTIIRVATPRWALRPIVNPAGEPSSVRFVTLPRGARRLAEAVALLGERLGDPMDPVIQLDADGVETRFEVLGVEIGAGLDDMDLRDEVPRYERVLDEPERIPSPHTTRQYGEAGRAYIEARREHGTA